MEPTEQTQFVTPETISDNGSVLPLGTLATQDTLDLTNESYNTSPSTVVDLQGVPVAEVGSADEPRVLLQRHETARLLGCSITAVKRAYGMLAEEQPELFDTVSHDNGRSVSAMWSTGLPELRKRMPAPRGWTHEEQLATELGVGIGSIRRVVNKVRDDSSDQFGSFMGSDDVVPREHFSDHIANHIRETVQGRIGQRAKREREQQVRDDFVQFAEDIRSGESIEAQLFEKFVNVFGPENAMDVVFRLRSDYKGKTVMPLVKSFLAEYLGDFIVKRGQLEFDNIQDCVDLLDDKNLQKALIGVVKRDCLAQYHRAIRSNPDQDDFDIIADYLDELRRRTEHVESEELEAVIKKVEDYYLSLFDMHIPDVFVTNLREGRPFPDLNQRINIREMQLNRRMLIGDDPGMGKSASAIITKEYVKAKCAVIVTPGIVFDDGVWQGYIEEYYEGKKPKVLVVDHPSKLELVTAKDYDYIIINQERMVAEYCDQLMGIDFDMLIVDEAHNFKNISEGTWSKNLLELAEKIEGKNKYLMMLSATPVPNKVVDIALALLLLYPKEYKQYAGEDGKYKQLIHNIIHSDTLEIRSKLLPRLQMKRLSDCIEMPPLNSETKWLELVDKHREAYEVILDEWELDAKEKLQFLQQVLLNPKILDATPDFVGLKARTVGEDLRQAFQTKDKIVMFVNNYVDGVIKGTDSIIPDLHIPTDVSVYTIYGEISKDDRRKIMHRFQTEAGKMLLVVSGQTVSVGVDLSAAQQVVFYNEPWTETAKMQQIGRSNRPGRDGSLDVITYLMTGTIEDGIHRYIREKYIAVEKLLYGIPLTELERELVERAEESDRHAFDINADLAASYFSAIDRLNKRIFGQVKEIGKDGLRAFLDVYGEEYARTYQDLTSRSYQANASRLSGTLIHNFVQEDPTGPTTPVILDMGSGPEMLRRHIPEHLTSNTISLDINPAHFREATGKYIVGTMDDTKMEDASVDYVNMSLAFHYTAWQPSNGKFERLETLAEINRVLKTGGRAVFTLMYSLDLRDEKAFSEIVQKLGFRVVGHSSGQVQTDESFKARVITLEKVEDCPTELKPLLEAAGEGAKEGLRFAEKKDVSLRDSRRIATTYTFMDQGILRTVFNDQDRIVWEEEQEILGGMKSLRDEHRKIEDIPAEQVVLGGFSRIFNGKGYVLFKRLQAGDGAVVFRNW